MDNEIKEMLRSLQEGMDNKFEKVDKRFDAMDEKFEKVDKRFDAVDEKFEKVDKRFDTVDQKLEEADKRFDRLEEGQQNILKELRSNTKHFEETVKEHRVVIDLMQREGKPEIKESENEYRIIVEREND